MKHGCKMNTVVSKSFNDRLKIATVSALMAGTFLCLPFTVYAENPLISDVEQTVRNISVKGVVVDANGEPVIGASVQLKGSTGIGTITDLDGKFTLSVPANGVLQISYIGYKTAEVKVNGQAGLKVTLQEDTETLDEVVVVGYGIQKKASVTGSVAAISSDKLMEVKAPSVTNMLAGRLPGLRAVQRSGSPGDDGASVDIRGYGSMLVIVDGIERDYAQLDPNDIESISILKDAAAAVYAACRVLVPCVCAFVHAVRGYVRGGQARMGQYARRAYGGRVPNAGRLHSRADRISGRYAAGPGLR